MENNNDKIINNTQVLTDAQIEALYQEVMEDVITNKIKMEMEKAIKYPELDEALGLTKIKYEDSDTERMREIFNNIINR